MSGYLLWSHDGEGTSTDEVQGEKMLRQAAIEADQKGIVVRNGLHNLCAARDANTRRITTVPLNSGESTNYTKPADWHYTVWLGESRDKIQLQGHIFVYGEVRAVVADPKPQR
ncbi:hypothetical protein B0T16DRAFT_386123 [Cercophora newfieldiana]|uniref:Uncharacterized protein n=1 Tax=Cercophora newfieldiana TaxID=92897 RepID=A0AA39YS45_9PEZI|nr:hypothetical protein B0T16DRAFT_386123 [Cercophora newfieldiana]